MSVGDGFIRIRKLTPYCGTGRAQDNMEDGEPPLGARIPRPRRVYVLFGIVPCAHARVASLGLHIDKWVSSQRHKRTHAGM